MKKFMKKKRSGQTIVEYILIVVLVAIASLVLLGLFSDTLRKKISGVISNLDTDNGATAQGETKASTEILKDLDAAGGGVSGN